MLDFSDEEPESATVRKRNHSPSGPPDSGLRPGNAGEGPPVDVAVKTQSIFKESGSGARRGTSSPRSGSSEGWERIMAAGRSSGQSLREFRERSSRLIMPMSNPPFVISEFVAGKQFKPKSELDHFGLNLKGGNAFQEPSDNEEHPDSFFKSMGTLVLLAQFFAVLPVSGIRGPNYKSITFKWLHYKMAYWGVTLLGAVFCFACATASAFEDEAFQAASGILYFACGILSSLLMLSLSRNWKTLNMEFANVELRLRKYGYPNKIGFKFKIFTVVALLVALGRLKSLKKLMSCSQRHYEFSRLVRAFFLNEYSEVFILVSYSPWKGVLVLIAHFLVAANWNFKDLFLGLISWTLAERFKQVHDLLDSVHGQDRPVSFWKEVREDFNDLSVLTKRVDAHIRKLMFLSMGNNLFFICIQLFHSLKKKLDPFRLLYFFWSFGFLVLRTGFVAFTAARINDESKEPKTILYSVPQKNYTAEVRRFLTQLTTNEVALTGSGFFSITRSLILTIIGSVITYEIVLVQFGGKETEDPQGNGTMCFQ